MTEAPPRSHWNAHARRWNAIGPPLRPTAADIQHVQQSVARWLPAGVPRGRALLLGVTPELAQIAWQPPLRLLAVDQSPGMAEGVWPGDTALRQVQIADWLSLSGLDAEFGLALGDGVFTLLQYPAGYRALATVLARAVAPQGLLCLRLFCRPAARESVPAVFDALFTGQLGNFHVFKWRLAMALQDEATHSVRLADVWQAFHERVPNPETLAAHTGFPAPEIATIDGYRGVQERYSYCSEQEVVAVLEPAFELLEIWYPSYELGERCPHLSFRRRGG